MLKSLEPLLPYLQNISLALLLMLLSYLLSIPIRRRFVITDDFKPVHRSGKQFIGVLLSYIAYPILVLLFSFPSIYFFYDFEQIRYDQTWLSFWAIYAIVRFVEGLIVETFVQFGKPRPLNRLMRGMLRLAVMLSVAFLLIRYQLGFKIGVLLTSTAIVTGVIGFAMQGVLGNLLAGMSLHTCCSMSVGDWIEVDGTIGQVTLVNWRETRLRTTGGHVVIVPNSKLADCTIRNFSSKTSLRRHEVPVAASYGDAPGDVITALIEAAQSISAVEKNPPPDAYVTGFKDFCIEYVLRFWSKQYELRTPIEGSVMRMIWYKFNRRGIEIPFPMSGRLLENFMQAVHAQQFEKPLESEIERNVDDLLCSDFGRKLMANHEGICILNREELKEIARNVKRTLFTHGETIMCQNDDGETFYILIHGKVQGSIKHSDTARNVEFELKSGAVFGEMSLLTGLPRSATMIAVTDCELLEFDRNAFTSLLSIREEIPKVLSDLAAARTAENAEAMEKLRASGVVQQGRVSDSILHRLKHMLSEWRLKRTK
ncbi:MAG: mechanosensitive ion channel [Sedimentisphaerales bacterium]|nr:mechanosensitive ion channel [Sedimentisphaerales bacterium]